MAPRIKRHRLYTVMAVIVVVAISAPAYLFYVHQVSLKPISVSDGRTQYTWANNFSFEYAYDYAPYLYLKNVSNTSMVNLIMYQGWEIMAFSG